MHTPEQEDVDLALCPVLLATYLNHNYPEVEHAVRVEPDNAVIKVNNQIFKESAIYKTDAAIFDVFTYKFIEGNPAQALSNPHSIVLTETLALKYFGKRSAMGKTLLYNNQLCEVTAVLADLPGNTDLKVNALRAGDFSKEKVWVADDFSDYTYVLFRQKPDYAGFKKKLADISKKYIQPELNKMGPGYALTFNAEALTDIHFSAGKLGDTPKGDQQMVYVFSLLAIIILVIALLNYINLSTARATERAKEVGIRKVNGALRSGLIRQFLFESFFVTGIALVFGILLMFFLLPFLNSLLHLQISWSGAAWTFLLICGLVLAASIVTGIYPAFILSSFKPATILKGGTQQAPGGLNMRKIITIVQFMMATVMIAGAFVMNRQINFIQHKSLGYDQDQVLNIALPDDSVKMLRVTAFNNALKQLGPVRGTAFGTGLAIENSVMPKANVEVSAGGIKRELLSNFFSIDEKFIPLLKMKLAAGRNFSPDMGTDKKDGLIVNEAFVKQAGWKQPLGNVINGLEHKGRVIGVVKNFHYASMHNPIAPLVMIDNGFKSSSVLVKMNPLHLNLVKNCWQTYFPEDPFSYEFLDDAFNKLYQKDMIGIRLFNYFTLLSILIACLGLYGLACLVATQRTKEIGIRKVLGAAINQLFLLLAKDFVKLIALAAILALPLTWFIMNQWLATYAYHIGIRWWLLLLPIVSILMIAVTVISYQTIKVAVTNPVNSLRSE